jgi:hypothetical protein
MIEADDIRRLLADYHHSLALARELALKLLDASQPDSDVLAPDIAARHRRLAGDAIARIEASESWVASLWKTFRVDRRQANDALGQTGVAPVVPDRRKHRHAT